MLGRELRHRNRAFGFEAVVGHHVVPTRDKKLLDQSVCGWPIGREHRDAFRVANGSETFQHGHRGRDERDARQRFEAVLFCLRARTVTPKGMDGVAMGHCMRLARQDQAQGLFQVALFRVKRLTVGLQVVIRAHR